MKESILLAVMSHGKFGLICQRGSMADVDLEMSAHVLGNYPGVKGYVIVDATGSTYYYDKEGQHVGEHTLPFKGV